MSHFEPLDFTTEDKLMYFPLLVSVILNALHFFNPPTLIKTLEIYGEKINIEKLELFANEAWFIPQTVSGDPGFVVNCALGIISKTISNRQ